MRAQTKVQIRTLIGLVDAPCYHQWKQDVGGVEFEFALHVAAGYAKGFDAPLAISEMSTGYDVKADLKVGGHKLTTSNVVALQASKGKKLAHAALHHLINRKVGPLRFLHAMLGAQVQLSKIDLGKYEVKGHPDQLHPVKGGLTAPGIASFTATATPEQVALLDSVFDDDVYIPSPEEHAAALADADQMNHNMRTYGTIDAPKVIMPTQANCLACEDTQVLTTTDKDHEGQPIEVSCTECIPDGELQMLKDRLEALREEPCGVGQSHYEDRLYNIHDLEKQIHDLESTPCSK